MYVSERVDSPHEHKKEKKSESNKETVRKAWYLIIKSDTRNQNKFP